MEFHEFTDRAVNFFQKQLGSNYQVSIRKATKNNGTILTALVITSLSSNIPSCIYLEKYYMSLADDGETFEAVMKNIMEAAIDRMYDISVLEDYESIREKIRGRLINTEKNRNFLSEVPHRKFLDLSITYVVLFEDEKNESQGSIQIDNAYMERLGVTEQVLYEIAKTNIEEFLLTDINSLFGAFSKEEDQPELGKSFLPMYVLSNQSRMYAALGMLDEKVMCKAAEIFGGDFTILPSSVHGLILVPNAEKMKDAEQLAKMVQEINRTQVLEEEVLSGHIYRYNHRTGEIVIVA